MISWQLKIDGFDEKIKGFLGSSHLIPDNKLNCKYDYMKQKPNNPHHKMYEILPKKTFLGKQHAVQTSEFSWN